MKSLSSKLAEVMPLMGHRNWIVVADSAYPWQSRNGIEMIDSGMDQLSAVKTVLSVVDKAKHIRPVIYLDAELPCVPEKDAPGIKVYRDKLSILLSGKEVKSLPHEQVIGLLDKAGETFKILMVKSDMTIPYTSVFLQLECGYWSPEAEKRLRDGLQFA